MTPKEILELVRAGFTKTEIEQMTHEHTEEPRADTQEPEAAPEPDQEPTTQARD